MVSEKKQKYGGPEIDVSHAEKKTLWLVAGNKFTSLLVNGFVHRRI